MGREVGHPIKEFHWSWLLASTILCTPMPWCVGIMILRSLFQSQGGAYVKLAIYFFVTI